MPKFNIVLEAIVPAVYKTTVEAINEDMALKKAIKLAKIENFNISFDGNKIPLRSSNVEQV